MLCTPKANGFADHYPVFKWLFHWEYSLFSDKPIYNNGKIRHKITKITQKSSNVLQTITKNKWIVFFFGNPQARIAAGHVGMIPQT